MQMSKNVNNDVSMNPPIQWVLINHSLSVDAPIMVSKNHSIIGQHIVIIFLTLYVTIATVLPAKNTLNFSFKHLYFKNGKVKPCLISRITCIFLPKFKNILYMGFIATLSFGL